MKVYLLLREYAYDGPSDIMGVFSTPDKAMSAFEPNPNEVGRKWVPQDDCMFSYGEYGPDNSGVEILEIVVDDVIG